MAVTSVANVTSGLPGVGVGTDRKECALGTEEMGLKASQDPS